MTGLNVPLTPLRYLERSMSVMPDKVAIIDGDRQWTYAEFGAEVQQVAGGLRALGVADGERVAYLATNSAELLMAHYAVPLAGGVLVPINTRLAPAEIEYICQHSGAMILVGESDLLVKATGPGVSLDTVSEIVELPRQDGSFDRSAQTIGLDELRGRGEGAGFDFGVDDEDRVISINYTSGTTGRPKGVMYTHRGAYLNSLGEIHHSGFGKETTYLWTLPMFHCNGWCTTWAVTAAMGTHLCLRAVRGPDMWSLIDKHQVSHLNGAPTVLTTLATAEEAHPVSAPLVITTAGAPPSPTVISQIHNLGIEIVHVYGLTETYGPYAVCEPQPQWAGEDAETRATLLARQGVGMLTSEPLRVVRAGTDESVELVDVAADGAEMGEIVMRGNGVMRGYYQDPATTEEAFAGGWFHSGDLGVMHPDGYVQLLDRKKDVVVSGGENISTVEVEQAILSNQQVVEVAVVGTPDEKWGERPKAFVVLVRDATVDADELLAHLKDRIATYKRPREIEIVDELPKTSTGKIRKHELRDREWGPGTTRIKG